MLKIQLLKHIRKINVNVKLDDTSETSSRSCCSPWLCSEDSVNGAVNESDSVNDVVKVWSRSLPSRPRLRPRLRPRSRPRLPSLALIIAASSCSKFDDSRRILLSKTRWRLFLNLMGRPLPLSTADSFTANREFMVMVISIASTSRLMSGILMCALTENRGSADQSEGGCSYSIFEGGVTLVKGGVYAAAALKKDAKNIAPVEFHVSGHSKS